MSIAMLGLSCALLLATASTGFSVGVSDAATGLVVVVAGLNECFPASKTVSFSGRAGPVSPPNCFLSRSEIC